LVAVRLAAFTGLAAFAVARAGRFALPAGRFGGDALSFRFAMAVSPLNSVINDGMARLVRPSSSVRSCRRIGRRVGRTEVMNCKNRIANNLHKDILICRNDSNGS
jgi:hypothetical protein